MSNCSDNLDDESRRVEALDSYEVMDTDPESELDEITKSATIIFQAPMSVISLIHRSRVHFKSQIGDGSELIKKAAFCKYTIQQKDLFVVEDSLLDERFNDKECCLNYPFIRFYAGVPLITPSGFNIGAICYLDNRPRKMTDNEIYLLKMMAKQIITNFELKMHIKRLIELNKKTQKLSNIKEEFFSNMSHELRTPLNAISGFTETLLRTELTNRQKKQLSIMQSSISHLTSIVNDILDSSKIDSNNLKIENNPFELRKLLKSTYAMFYKKAKEKGVKMMFNICKNIPCFINGDKVRLNQILINLIGNSLKFTSEGSVILTVDILYNSEKEIELFYTVEDTGIGIPSDKIDIIFSRFQQVEGITRVFGGSGLGLSISKSLVELQKGKLEVKSVIGKGSKFTFSIKHRVLEDNEIAMLEMEKKSTKCYIKPKFNKMKLLLVEDNILNAKLIEHLCEGTGIELEISPNGKNCIEKLNQKKFDIILMDLFMPVMDGYEATKFIRENMKLDTPIIAISANIEEKVKSKCLEYGMNDYVTKPFEIDKLFASISRFSVSQQVTTHPKSDKKRVKSKAVSAKNFNSILSYNREEGLAQDLIPQESFQTTTMSTANYDMVNQKNYCEKIKSYLKEYSGNDQEFEKEFMELFLKEMPEYFLVLEKEIEKINFNPIKNAVHKMKSPMKIFHLTNLVNIMEEIENFSDVFKMDYLLQLIQESRMQFDSFFSKMKEVLIAY